MMFAKFEEFRYDPEKQFRRHILVNLQLVSEVRPSEFTFQETDPPIVIGCALTFNDRLTIYVCGSLEEVEAKIREAALEIK
jgi:hypothetical protein